MYLILLKITDDLLIFFLLLLREQNFFLSNTNLLYEKKIQNLKNLPKKVYNIIHRQIVEIFMKTLRYIIFISILSTIFLVIYRQSDKKGLNRLWVSIRIAIFLAAIHAGLIPSRVQASENDFPNNSSLTPIERNVKYIRAGFKSMDNNKPENQCPRFDQNKAGVDELPDSSKFIYNLETKTAKKTLQKVWKNPNAKKEVLDGLARMDSGELLPRNEKNFKKFKTLKEIKLTNTRMLVRPGKDGAPDEILVIFMKKEIKNVENNLKKKYD